MNLSVLNKNLDWVLGLAVLFTAFVYSFYFAQERVLNTDNSSFLFNTINGGKIWIAEKRYSSAIPIFPAFIASKLSVSLSIVINIFSVSYFFLYLIISITIAFVLKNLQGLLILSLSLFLGVNYSFYHPVTETHQAIAYSVLFFGCLNSNLQTIAKYFITVLSFFLALFAHPTAVFMLGFALLWHLLPRGLNKKNMVYWITLIALGLFTVLRSKLNQNNYDAVQYENLYSSINNIGNFFKWNSVKYIEQTAWLYVWPLFFWSIALFVFFAKNNILKFLTLGLLPLLFIFIALTTFSGGDSQMMMEKSFMPAFAMVAMSLNELMKEKRTKSIVVGLSLVYFVFCFIGINQTGHKVFRKRLNAIDAFITKQNNNDGKYLANIEESPDVWKNYWWATSADVLMRAVSKHNKQVTLYLYSPDENIEHAQKSESFMYVNWWPNWEIHVLNKTYFNLPEIPYKKINLYSYE
ncbi:MAG: hypothetical protein ACK4K9_02645 [Bacteroidia bacterium]